MKHRDQLYHGERHTVLQLISDYHTLRYEQILHYVPLKPESIRHIVNSLVKQGRIYYDKANGLLCDCRRSAESPDYGTIAAFWVLLDFKDSLIYHTSGEFPVKLYFFCQDNSYEVIYIAPEHEILMNHILEEAEASDTKRLIIIESASQARHLDISNVSAYCIVRPDGSVDYFKKESL